MSSMAFFTRTKASSCTLMAMAARRGLLFFKAAVFKTLAAAERRSLVSSSWMNAGLKVLVKRSCASSELNTARALEQASISSWRVF